MERLARLGIFGGSFDPVHLGHLILAAEALHQLKLDRVLWVLTPEPPHKPGQHRQSLDDRLAMLHIAISEYPQYLLSRVDIDRPPPTYAVDTVRLIAEQYPQSELVYLIGGDSLHDLPTWHDPAGLVQAVTALGVMRRPDDHIDPVDLAALEKGVPGISQKLLNVDAPLLEISSSGIRMRITTGRPFCHYLPLGVYFLIRERQLYDYQNG
jgi:nicotinate-nucleotide adenylyltransferase